MLRGPEGSLCNDSSSAKDQLIGPHVEHLEVQFASKDPPREVLTVVFCVAMVLRNNKVYWIERLIRQLAEVLGSVPI